MIQQMIHQWQKKADTVRLCRLLGVSRSGLYAARRRRPRPCALSAPLQSAFRASGGNYGSRRLCAALKAQGLPAGRHRVRRLMKQHGLRARWKRTFVHTTDSRHDLSVAANLVDRQFNSGRPIRPGRQRSPPSAPTAPGCTWPPCWSCIRRAQGAVSVPA